MRNRHATAVAYLALFVALGGSAYAVTQVTSRQIKNNTVRSIDVKDRALRARDFKTGQLPAGSQGPKGDPGAAGQDGTNGAAGAPGTAKAFAFVNNGGGLEAGRFSGVNSVTHPDIGAIGMSSDDNLFCFDLDFDPKIAVASPFSDNAGDATAADNGQGAVASTSCTAPNDDALVRTWAPNGTATSIGFSVIFE